MTFAEDLEYDRDNVFLDADEFAASVTYESVSASAEPTTSVITAFAAHLPDLSAQTQRPFFRRVFRVSLDDVTPKRGDKILDADGTRWTVLDVERADESGMVRLQTKILQTKD